MSEIVDDGSALAKIPEADLRGKQQAALEVLSSGKSVAEAARTVGISRTSIHRWIRQDPVFQEAYQQWKQAVTEASRTRMLTLSEKAADAVEKALEAGDAKLGLQLLKGLGHVSEKAGEESVADKINREIKLGRIRDQQRRDSCGGI